MDGNKDEALRCIGIAKAALASRDKQKALKFIKLAKRLNDSLPVDNLFVACEKLESSKSRIHEEEVREMPTSSNSSEPPNGYRNYTQEHVKLIQDIKRKKDYYAILGVEKSCLVEDIRKAYRKLSLKVHPDKNKAPGADDAFKIVSKAFKCLNDEDSRREYDQVSFIEGCEFANQHNNKRRRRRAARNDYFDENFDSDEIFRSFFFGSQDNVQHQRFYRARETRRPAHQQREHNVQGGGFNWIMLFQILPVLLFFLFAYLPFTEPYYSIQKNYAYQIPKVTEKHGVEYFVKLSDFDQKFPQGSSDRNKLEDNILRDYKNNLARACRIESQRRHWVRDYPTPHCDKLRSLGVSVSIMF